MMKLLLWLLRLAVFIALFGLAVKNSVVVELRFFLDRHLEAPLSLVILATFALGAILGLSVAFATVFHQRREIGRLRRQGTDNAGGKIDA